jgi:dTDP-4-dehydrorhamnose reductase
MESAEHHEIPIWGGFECSIIRIGDCYRDELLETGHLQRDNDLELLSKLCIKTLRYGVLWEHVAASGMDAPDWSWTDRRLSIIRDLGITPVVGLLHHGSGPPHTNLLNPLFPQQLARYAAMVADRYPWVRLFTPVNEPVTTARFSCLYGHWFPHMRDHDAFLCALFNQVYGIVLSMRAIRHIIPDAQLIQPEELGRVFSTPPLAYQATYENDRRWLSLDLLCGRVNSDHPWFSAFVAAGIDERLLCDISDTPCAPDIIGMNYYLSSDRYLDHRLSRYPRESHGGNGRDVYADVEAARVDVDGACSLTSRLLEAWERYRLPLAVTEIHNGCTREEQLRWLTESFEATRRAELLGVDICGFTVWALAGSTDWSSLLTRREGNYESGALDAGGGQVRRTALCGAIAGLSRPAVAVHPVLDGPGWWRRDLRYYNQDGDLSAPTVVAGRRVLIVGANGTLGHAFKRLCHLRGLPFAATARLELDIAEASDVKAALERHRPWAVINAAGYVRVRDAEREPDRCYRENRRGAEVLAEACAERGLQLVTFSSDLVFDGQLGRAYIETDEPSPVSVYGLSKADAEQRVRQLHPHALIVRTGAFFGPWDRYNFVHSVLSALVRGIPFAVPEDAQVSPTYVPDLVNRVLDLVIDAECGLWHLANEGALRWSELARRVALEAGLDGRLIAITAPATTSTALRSMRGPALSPLTRALQRYLREREA